MEDRAVDSILMDFYRRVAQEYLELHGLSGTVRVGPNRLTLDCGSSRFQLRLKPDLCRWLLFVGKGKHWQPYRGEKACLDLMDRLKEIRRLTTVAPDCRK